MRIEDRGLRIEDRGIRAMRHALCALRSAWSMVSSMRFALCALRDQRGVFIVEVLVAGVVFAIAVIGLVLMFGWGQTFVVAQGNDRVALYLAQQQIESLRASGYAAAEALNSNCGGNPGLDETLTAGRGNSQSFTRQTDVEYVNNADLTTPQCGTNTIRITVTVTPTMVQAFGVTLQSVCTNVSGGC